ncbi:MAG: ribose-phosphate pyrophosphokinase, partial [Proteobacteria bacterium]|nr:ribose-phosphate pyrophosphokinase [Pseudomonadota bacterium]
ADDEIRVRIDESVRGADVFVIQPTCPPTAQNLMELLLILDALKRASARRSTAVIPYYGYARQEKKVKPREPISAKLVADLISVAGADRLLTVDLHVQSIQGFFNMPVDHLPGGPLLAQDLVERSFAGADTVVVSPDVGGVGAAKTLADRLNASLAIIAKRRPEADRVEVIQVIGELEGKRAILIDDIIDTGRSLVSAANMVAQAGASEIYAYATHAVLSGEAVDEMEAAPIKEVVVTDTIPLPESKRRPKLRVLSMAPILAEAIRRVHGNISVSTLFDRYWEEDKK